MITCQTVLPAKHHATVVDTITLDETDRRRRRFRMTSDNGIVFLLDLENTVFLREGDHLQLSDGRCIEVRADPEALYEVRARDSHHLLTLSWHLGNRHLPTQILTDHLRIRADTVIAEMLQGLGADVTEVSAGFNPEGGAYGEAHSHSHSHSHGNSHSHEHQHDAVHE